MAPEAETELDQSAFRRGRENRMATYLELNKDIKSEETSI